MLISKLPNIQEHILLFIFTWIHVAPSPLSPPPLSLNIKKKNWILTRAPGGLTLTWIDPGNCHEQLLFFT